MKKTINLLGNLLLGMLLGGVLVFIILIKPIVESYDKKLSDKDSIYYENLNFQDSIYRVQVRMILSK